LCSNNTVCGWCRSRACRGAAFQDRSYVRHVGIPALKPQSRSHRANSLRIKKTRMISITTRVAIMETLMIAKLREIGSVSLVEFG